MRVRFTQIASVQGRGYRPGDVADLPVDVARVYCRVGQAEAVDDEPEPSPTPTPQLLTEVGPQRLQIHVPETPKQPEPAARKPRRNKRR